MRGTEPCALASGRKGQPVASNPSTPPEDSGGSGMAQAGVCGVSAQASVWPKPPGPRLSSPWGRVLGHRFLCRERPFSRSQAGQRAAGSAPSRDDGLRWPRPSCPSIADVPTPRGQNNEHSCSNSLANSEKKYLATYGSPVGVLTRRDQGCYFHGKPSPRPRDLLALGPAPCLCREGLEVHGGKAPPSALAPRWTSGRRRSRSLRLGPRGPSVWPQQHPREHCFKGVSWTFSQDTCGQGRDKKGGNVLF